MRPEDLVRLVSEAEPSELPGLVGALEEARAHCWVRLAIPAPASDQKRAELAPAGAGEGRLLTAQEAAGIAGVSPRWLRRHTKGLRFRHDLSRKLARFEEAGFRRWLQARRGLTGTKHCA